MVKSKLMFRRTPSAKAGLLHRICGKTIYNYLIDGRKFTHDIGSTSAITTTHTSFQFDAVSRVAIHHALLTSGLEPQDVELTVTLPVAMFFTSDAQLNEANIEKKKANVMPNNPE